MKAVSFFLFIVIAAQTITVAQPSQQQRIQDTVLGWWSTQNINEVPKPYVYQGRTFTTKQQLHMMNMIEWMKKSYIPVAGLGTFKRMIFSDDHSNPPHSYGVDFRVWNVDFDKEDLDKQGHFKPVPEEYTRFGVTANACIGSYAIDYINTPTQYLFAWQPNGFENYKSPKMNKADPKIHPNVYKYITRITDITMAVYLAPDNKLPVVPLTKGEFLQLAYEAMDRLPEKRRLIINDTYLMKTPEGNRERADAMNRVMQEVEGYKKNIRLLQEKYRNSLSEPAIINHMQPSEHDFSGYNDPFEISAQARNSMSFYQVYKMEKAVLDKCKTDQPQWMVIWFPFETKEDGNQLFQLSNALREHFNYDYAYNYFFNPEKIRGQTYKPLNEELLNATLEKYRRKEYWANPNENKPLPSNVHFADDFSRNNEGSLPAGWFFNSRGKHCTVATIQNQPGKWVKLGFANEFSPTSLKKPLPQNFTLEYNMVTDYFGGRFGGSAFLYMSTWSANANGRENVSGKGASLRIEINAGNEADFNNNNYRGIARLSLNKSPEVNVQNNSNGASYTYDLREFNNKTNKVHITLKINNGDIKLLINNKAVVTPKDMKLAYGGDCIDCKIPPDLRFNTIYWRNTTDDVDKTGVYISNVTITKD